MALVAQADIDRLRTGARRFASGFTPGQKAVSLAAVVAVVLGGYFFMSVAGKPSYAPLFTNLSSSDAAAITTKLAAANVPYQLQDGGNTIDVPQNDVDQQRINMASAGLPAASNNVGLGLLDKEGITTSQATQQADYLQAIQGELESTIGAIQGVTGVQVNVAMPAASDFALSDTSPTGASVLVDTSSGAALSNGEVQAIVHLVASSVPGLSASDVTVADNNGNLLAGPGVSNTAGSDNGSTAGYEAAQQAKISAYLESVLGPGNADIQVNAQLDFDQIKTTTNGIQTAGPKNTPVTVPTETQTSTETATGGATGGGGTLGTTATATAGTTGSGNYNNSSSTTNYESGTVTQTDSKAPGSVVSQSIAIVVNSKSLPKGVSLSSLKAGAAAAAGLNTSRGDTMVMSAAPFSTAVQAAASKAAAATAAVASKQSFNTMIRNAALALLLLMVMFLLWRSAKKSRLPQRTPMLMPLALNSPIELDQGLEMMSDVPALGGDGRGQTHDRSAEMTTFIDSQPAEVAALLRAWSKERNEPSVAGRG